MRQNLSNIVRSPLGLILLGFLLAIVLVQVEVRLQVAAYWETHPQEWQIMVALEAKDPGWTDWLARWNGERQKVLAARQAVAAQAKQPKFDAEAIDRLLDKRDQQPKGLDLYLAPKP